MIVAPFHGGQNYLAKIIDVATAGVLRRKFHFFAVLASKPDHVGDARQRFFPRDAELVLQVQIGCSQEKVQPRFYGGFQSS